MECTRPVAAAARVAAAVGAAVVTALVTIAGEPGPTPVGAPSDGAPAVHGAAGPVVTVWAAGSHRAFRAANRAW
jgi:hypothetical protein